MSKTPPNNRGKRIAKINRFTQALLIKYLLEGIYSAQELAEMTGLHDVTVRDYTRELCRVGAAHIASWDKDSRGRDVVKIVKLGPGKDAKRQRLTDAERQRAYRKKKQQQTTLRILAGGIPHASP